MTENKSFSGYLEGKPVPAHPQQIELINLAQWYQENFGTQSVSTAVKTKQLTLAKEIQIAIGFQLLNEITAGWRQS